MNQKRILLVDDDPDQRLTLRLPLENAGYAVSEAAGLDAGLEAVIKFKPNLVILDVMMDTQTSGFQFALTMHTNDPQSPYKDFDKTPIIMLTAIHSTTPMRFRPDEDYLPVEEFLEKPVEPEVLLATVRRHLSV